MTTKLIRLPVVSFRKVASPYDESGAKTYIAVVNVKDLPEEFEQWRTLNLRDPKTTSGVAKKIFATLEDDPDSFFFRNRGITVIAEKTNFDNQKNVLEIEMAGASKETIQTSVEGNKLEITGKTVVPDLPKEYTPLYSEHQHLQYQRAFVLGVELQPDKIRASYDNGLLRLTIPKIEKPKPKIIAIE